MLSRSSDHFPRTKATFCPCPPIQEFCFEKYSCNSSDDFKSVLRFSCKNALAALNKSEWKFSNSFEAEETNS